ncbi:hypothetical protein A6C57_00320 [Fibrella sp. ES10-3-2-2]|nr:hypothetical protein A6C57_00320 [Fibrella sp. ES10-3-2-2]
MKKTPLDVLTILLQRLRGSALDEAITGKVRKLKRPAGSRLEDVVINTIAISPSQIQLATANVNIYVPDLLIQEEGGSQSEANLIRLGELSLLAIALLEGVYTQQYCYTLGKQYIIEEPLTNSHYLNLRVEFQFFS